MEDKRLSKLEGKSFIVSSKWVEVENYDLYLYLLEILDEYRYVDKKVTDDDIQEFKNGKWLVEYSFHKNENDELIMYVSAGSDKQGLANQPEWIIETIREEHPVDAYLEVLNTNEEKAFIRKRVANNKTVELLEGDGKIDLAYIYEDIPTLQKVLLEDYGIDTEVVNEKLININ